MEGILSSTVVPEFEWIVDSLDGVRRTRYLALASSALLCYEYVLTFDQEVRISEHFLLLFALCSSGADGGHNFNRFVFLCHC